MQPTCVQYSYGRYFCKFSQKKKSHKLSVAFKIQEFHKKKENVHNFEEEYTRKNMVPIFRS